MSKSDDRKSKGNDKSNGKAKASGNGKTKAKTKANGKGIGKSEYEDFLEPLQIELNQLARWVQHRGKRVVVLFEGRDTAGKGGVISAIAETLNPRQFRVVALPKPSDAESTQWYFQRYVAHLPAAGEIVLFDRSWYNRAGVEKVMGFCTDEEYRRFLREAPVFEKLLVDDGILLFKYWLTVDQERQEERFQERFDDPLKRWKLSPIDLKARTKYREYGKARDAMLEATHTEQAPWTLVDFNDQRRGRLTLIRHLLDRVPDVEVPVETFKFPPLHGAPLREEFAGPLRPIPHA
ncbi:polyphosphate kinase 2 [Quisquiliibacterium transsilvanicum]|uniref:ADP/GDP-polyphosphate phosphotransferase n=1 Tax=Quisquiliibacterium transsilvanicum TaxID=1549638 RepID=A0A7W8HFQ6_9BURK|nr:polyphosphate kinase 2 [Quisquiliibacterium transsilvanicum]MBB5271160.1 polyphosphate kinase 2 [Quisquiliibacterium transsilvanicum]